MIPAADPAHLWKNLIICDDCHAMEQQRLEYESRRRPPQREPARPMDEAIYRRWMLICAAITAGSSFLILAFFLRGIVQGLLAR